MEVTVYIPDDLVSRMNRAGADLSRRALEGLALEEYRNGHISEPDLLRLLGFQTRYELDGFLKAHGLYENVTMADIDRDLGDLKSLGL
jgi:Uncharacterised protein family (UPF0175)